MITIPRFFFQKKTNKQSIQGWAQPAAPIDPPLIVYNRAVHYY